MTKEDIDEYVARMKADWFITEPAYFITLCSHIIDTEGIEKCPVYCGGGVIYINPAEVDCSYETFCEMVMVECLRILLKHPYQRLMPDRRIMLNASDITIGEYTTFRKIYVPTPGDILHGCYYDRLSMEEYYDLLNKDENVRGSGRSNNQSGSGKSSGSGYGRRDSDFAFAATSMWGEDDIMSSTINSVIEKIKSLGENSGTGNSCGSMPGDVIETICASKTPDFNYRGLLHIFRGSILSSARTLTRMKPNRRFGFSAMGSRRSFTTRILVAVDVSGSMSSKDISFGLGFINGFFKYGVESIGCCTFDICVDRKNYFDLTSSIPLVNVTGRGGTSFDDIFKYSSETGPYDGVIIFTDGYASVPRKQEAIVGKNRRTKFLWLANNKKDADRMIKMNEFTDIGFVTYIEKI